VRSIGRAGFTSGRVARDDKVRSMLECLNNNEASRVSSVADCQGASNLSRGVAAALPCCVDDVMCVSASSPARALRSVVETAIA